ncbi:UDP-N-acetylmuramate--L-alanine ligase [Oceanidesulfovibrio marinus]|uniref:UDP-N-acetylmuramate--L-alanine ligase n=1 Tax=Oceanidesulfovibrio marinus TaxID=370038 RepID=A0A6P1ZLM8_9BACT|nr:UDP-N-acetylmuramate--L-alanine ligase [Oceanidesulfovibrio marinus]TVM36716.1 UDP-N-acetylmuramate--L-alanine ligase [Oceanidesulfovibrio marinus]
MFRTKVTKVHMIGIGGSGMSGIAEVLLNLDYTVTGSDMSAGPMVDHLKALGATIHQGHEAGNLGDAQVVVRSTAIKDDNPEVMAANQLGIPVIPRAEMLAELMRLRTGIAVAGTHGKTTTTSLLAEILDEAGLDPTVIIGGRLNAYGSNARLGEGELMLAEADESDGSFLCLLPIITVVTNVDADHLDFYEDLDAIDDAFVQFMNGVPFYGMNVVCGDDPGVQRLIPRVRRPVLTYGLKPENDLRAVDVEYGPTSSFTVIYKDRELGRVSLRQPGRHNVLNALAAIGVGLESDIPADKVLAGLARFGGVGRRFEHKGEKGGVLVVDDYGHHPAEIRATIETARLSYPDKRLVLVFQPHRFSRTQALFGEFCQAFDNVDELLLTEIYPASEKPIPGVSGMSLAQGISQISQTHVSFFPKFDDVNLALPTMLKEGDLLLTMGAGNVWQIGMKYLEG